MCKWTGKTLKCLVLVAVDSEKQELNKNYTILYTKTYFIRSEVKSYIFLNPKKVNFLSNGHSPANLSNSSTRQKFANFGEFEYSPKWPFSEIFQTRQTRIRQTVTLRSTRQTRIRQNYGKFGEFGKFMENKVDHLEHTK